MTVLNSTKFLFHTGAVMECLPNCNVQLVAAMGVVFFLGVTLMIRVLRNSHEPSSS